MNIEPSLDPTKQETPKGLGLIFAMAFLVVCIAFIVFKLSVILSGNGADLSNDQDKTQVHENYSLGQRVAFALHPDDKTMAFVGRQGELQYLYLQHENGDIRLIKALKNAWPDIRMAWSPDGEQLVVRWNEDRTYLVAFSFDKKTLELVAQRELSTDSSVRMSTVNWLDNQTLLVIKATSVKASYNVYTLSLDTLDYLLVPNSQSAQSATTSSGYSAYTRFQGLKTIIKASDAKGQELFTYTSDSEIRELAFLPNNEGLLLFERNSPSSKIVYFDGRESAPDIGLVGPASSPQFSQDGQTLYLLQYRQNLDVWKDKLEFKTLSLEKVLNTSDQEKQAKCINHSKEFVYVSNSTGKYQIWLSQGDSQQQLTNLSADSKISDLHVSNDGLRLVFKSDDDILYYDFSQKSTHTVLANASLVSPLGFDETNQYIYYTYRYKNNNVDINFWRHEIATGRNEELPIPVGHDLQAIVSKGILYYLDGDIPYLHMMSSDGTVNKFTNVFPIDTLFLAENEKSLFYFLPRRQQRKQIWQYNKLTQQHSIILKRDFYQGDITDICDDEIVFIEYDNKNRIDLFKISAEKVK